MFTNIGLPGLLLFFGGATVPNGLIAGAAAGLAYPPLLVQMLLAPFS